MVGSAGGIASLIAYPALLAVGIAPLPANVADTLASVASLPGSALGSRPELRGQGSRVLRLAPLAVAGSGAGAVLLLLTPAGVFGRIVPFLVAFAALALLVQPRVSAWLETHPGRNGGPWSSCGLFAVWVYCGYWGVGAGVMALAVLTLAVEPHLAQANALKNVLLGVADVAGSVVFIVYGPVRWAAVVPLAFGFLTGSRVGPSLAGAYLEAFSALWSHWPASTGGHVASTAFGCVRSGRKARAAPARHARVILAVAALE